MSMRNIAIAGAALALALGCEREREVETTEPVTVEEQRSEERAARTDDTLDTRFEQAPERQQRQQQQQPGQQQPGQQQPGQQQHGQMDQQQAGQPGQVVTHRSDQNFQRTLTQLTREMRQNDLDVVAQVRYDRRTRERALRQMEQQGEQAGRTQRGQQMGQPQQQQRQQQMGQGTTGQQQERIGDVRLIVFRHTTHEAQAIEQQGAEAILNVPREVLVYERGDQVIVAYRTPPQMEAPGGAEPTSELLSRVVRNVAQPEQQRQRAEIGQEQQEQQAELERMEEEDARQARMEQERAEYEN